MDQRQKNNLLSDQASDQIMACIRDGREIPDDLDVVAAAARLPSRNLPEGMRESAKSLHRLWAKEKNLDVVE